MTIDTDFDRSKYIDRLSFESSHVCVYMRANVCVDGRSILSLQSIHWFGRNQRHRDDKHRTTWRRHNSLAWPEWMHLPQHSHCQTKMHTQNSKSKRPVTKWKTLEFVFCQFGVPSRCIEYEKNKKKTRMNKRMQLTGRTSVRQSSSERFKNLLSKRWLFRLSR